MIRPLRQSVAVVALGMSAAFTVAGQSAAAPGEGPEMMNARREWLFRQRAYPLGFIPGGIRAQAVMELNRQLSRPATRKSTRASVGVQSAGWTLIGPNPTVNLTFNGMITAAWTDAIAVDPRNPNVAYLGAPAGGVWKTTDGGAHWTPLTDTQPSLAIGSIAIDPVNPDIVYAGTGDSYLYGEGLLKSTNAGATWTYIAGPFTGVTDTTSAYGGGAHINQISVHPTNDQIVLAAVWKWPYNTSGIYRSTDGGTTWQQVFSNGPGTSVTFDPTNGSVAYAAISDYFGNALSGIYKSTNAGQTWAPTNGSSGHQLPLTNAGTIRLAMAPSSTSTLYAAMLGVGTFAPLSPQSLFTTTDGGATWNPISNLPTPGNKGMTPIVHPLYPNIVFVGEQNLYRSTDSGQTWVNILHGANGVNLFGDVRAFGFSQNGATLYAGCDGGPWSTTDAANQTVNWTNLTATLATTQFYPGMSLHPTDRTIAFAGAQDQGVQKYSGTPAWNTVLNCDGGWTAIDTTTPTNVYAVCEASGFHIWKSTTSGNYGTFAAAQTGIATSDRAAFIPPMVIDPSHPQNLYFGTYRIYQTSNGGSSWTAISGDLTKGAPYGTISAIAVAPTDSNRVYAGTGDGRLQTTANATAGATAIWSDVSAGLPNRFVSQVVVDPSNASTAYAIMSGFTYGSDTKGHVFKTTTAGSSWTDISSNLPNIPADDLVVDPDIANTLYVATDIGVYITSNGGGVWSPLATGLPRTIVSSLKLHRPSRALRAATLGRSVWELSVPLGPSASVTRDFVGNGRSDALLYDAATGTTYTALSNGNGTYQYVGGLFTPAFDTLRTGDFNGDGKADLVLYNSHTALAYIGMSNGDGTFAFQSLFWSPGYDFVEAGDLNGDGKTDFALYNSSTGTMYTGISNGTGTFSYKYTLISPGFTFARLADFTGDGKADLFVYNKANGAAYLGIGDGAGGFAFKPLITGPGYDQDDIGDLNGDGKADVVLYNSSNGNAATGISDGMGGFTFNPMLFSTGFTSVRLGDYTGDGKADITVYNKNNGTAYFGTGNGTGGFAFQSLFWSPGYDTVVAQDVNGDGKSDIILYNITTGTEYTGISNGTGTFTYTYSLWGPGKTLAR